MVGGIVPVVASSLVLFGGPTPGVVPAPLVGGIFLGALSPLVGDLIFPCAGVFLVWWPCPWKIVDLRFI